VPGLRAQQTFLLEDKARSNEDTAEYGEDDANDLRGGDNGVVNDERWLIKKGGLETLRLPETCKDDLTEEEGEGVDEDMTVRNQACVLEDYSIEGAGQSGAGRLKLTGHIGNHSWPGATGAAVDLYSSFRSLTLAVAKAVYPDIPDNGLSF